MQISISGKQIDIGSALREYVETELSGIITKYFEHAIYADVVFSKERRLFSVDIIVNEGTGTNILIKGEGKDDEIYVCFDKAAERIEKQLRRYKRRIKNHHKQRFDKESDAFLRGTKYIISHKDEEETDEGNPLIIAEKPTEIETLSVGDAVMRMDLAELPAMLFINIKTSNLNVVYRRKDGNISWIDPDFSVKKKASKIG